MPKKNRNIGRNGHTSTSPVKAKKHIGQHFLKDEKVALQISETLHFKGYQKVLEIGPGTGVLTKYLLLRDMDLTVMELDSESITYLRHSFPLEHPKILAQNKLFTIVEADFLKFDLTEIFGDEEFAITGNFPYNISSQIVFKTIAYEISAQLSEQFQPIIRKYRDILA